MSVIASENYGNGDKNVRVTVNL